MNDSATPEGDNTSKPLAQGRALRLHAYGGTDSLKVDMVHALEPGPDQVLVQVKAAGINGIDWKVREGYLRERFNLVLPATLGIEMSGVVLRVGSNVKDVSVGERVMAALGGLGAYADHLVINAEKLIKTPAGLSDIHAAAVPVAAMTAWQVLQVAEFDLPGKTGAHPRRGWWRRQLRCSIRQGGRRDRLCHSLDKGRGRCPCPRC